MSFQNVGYLNASHSTFNEVGRDQIINNFTVLVCTSGFSTAVLESGPRRAPHPRYVHGPSRIRGNSQTYSQCNSLVVSHHTSETVSLIHIAAGLIDKIVQLLSQDRDSSERYQDLRLELDSLHLTLFLTGSAFQVFKHTPLDRSLATLVSPQVGRCFTVLQELFDKLNHYRRGLLSSTISHFWPRVVWVSGELTSLKRKLSTYREALDEFLMALNSYVFTPSFNITLNTFPPPQR